MEQIVFTPSSIVDLLSKIDELKDYEIGISETIDGNIQLQIGSSVYEISDNHSEEVVVEENVVNTVIDTNMQAYENLDEDGLEVITGEPVESGLIKEIAKSLLVGGMVRLTSKLIGKDLKLR